MTALYLLNTTLNGLGFRDLSLGVLGDGVQSDVTNTATGPQDILIATWITPQLAAVNLGANTITINIWGLESSMNANCGFKVNIYRTNSSGVNQSLIATATMPSELTTPNLARNWTVTATATNLQANDRIKVEVRFTDVGGTMASGYSVTEYYDGTTTGQSGDSYVSFVETISPASSTTEETASAAKKDYLTASNQINITDLSLQNKKDYLIPLDNVDVENPLNLTENLGVGTNDLLNIEETLYED